MQASHFDKKKAKDEEEVILPFVGLKKGTVLQNVRIFSSPKLNVKECYYLLTKVLYILHGQGESFTTDEATAVFIAVTKLFQSSDPGLRRMMFLLLKELGPKAEETIMAFASLVKDINSDVELNRANAIRAICGLMDAKLLSSTMERYLKQAIVDREPYVASAGLIAGSHLASHSMDVIKRWTSEIQEALNSPSVMVQYHALGLLHRIKAHDRLAVTKLVKNLSREVLRSHLGHCLLIRYATQVLEESAEMDHDLLNYIENCLRHKSEVVVYEAARSLCGLKNITGKDLSAAVSVLQVLLVSSKATTRFAAVKTLNKVATRFPAAITSSCIFEMESLITDVNRSIATLAITTLLKVESETNVDRLMKQISAFISDICDEDKLIVVDGITTLSTKYPAKHYTIMNYLAQMLKNEGGKEYKTALVEAILGIIKQVPDAKETGLERLCEFIEDCEFPALATQVLHLLGSEGPSTSTPTKYIRYIYNRVCLETEKVRASAVSALAQFGLKHAGLRPKIAVLLRRSLYDTDDEVRDRATFYYHMLSSLEDAQKLMNQTLEVPLQNLETDLLKYLENPSDTPFDIGSVSTVSVVAPRPVATPGPSTTGSKTIIRPDTPTQAVSKQEQILSIPAIQKIGIGELLCSSKPEPITEAEAAFPVTVTKHLFPDHIVLAFAINSTVNDQTLRKLHLEIGSKDRRFKCISMVPASVLACNDVAHVYAVFTRPRCGFEEGKGFVVPSTKIFVNLQYNVHEVDPNTGEEQEEGDEDESKLDEVVFGLSDCITRTSVSEWNSSWDNLGEEKQGLATFAKKYLNNLTQACTEMIGFLGMVACDGSAKPASGVNRHILYLSGTFVDFKVQVPVLARIRMRAVEGQGIVMELAVRCEVLEIAEALANAIFA